MDDTQKLQRLEREITDLKSDISRLSYTVGLLCRRSETESWLDELTVSERAHWEQKPECDKDWWFANTQPADRARLLRSEMSVGKTRQRLMALPEAERDAIMKRLDDQAEEAMKKLRARGFGRET
jgi:hypothetical protein